MNRYAQEKRKPEWLRSVPRTKPRRDEPGQLLTSYEAASQDAIRMGSDMLLQRIWERHKRIMLVAEASGRLVMRPGQIR